MNVSKYLAQYFLCHQKLTSAIVFYFLNWFLERKNPHWFVVPLPYVFSDQGSNLQPWLIRTTLQSTELPGQGNKCLLNQVQLKITHLAKQFLTALKFLQHKVNLGIYSLLLAPKCLCTTFSLVSLLPAPLKFHAHFWTSFTCVVLPSC